MIQKAVEEGKGRIRCDVSHVPGCTETELSIRKVAARMMPEGGVARYPELIRNAIILFNMLLSSMENPVVHSHGGNRRKGFINNPEENVRYVLAERLGKSDVTIDKYLSFGEYLNEEASRVLIETDKNKDFFERAQKAKKLLLRKMVSEEEPEETIRNEISAAMIRMAEDESQIDIIADSLSRPPEQETTPESTPQPASNEPTDFKHWTGNMAPELPRITEKEVRDRMVDLGKRIADLAENKGLPLPDLKEEFERDLGEGIALLQDITGMLEREESGPLEVAG
jgi:hypothetical protein